MLPWFYRHNIMVYNAVSQVVCLRVVQRPDNSSWVILPTETSWSCRRELSFDKIVSFLYVVVSDACSDYTSSDSENNAWKPIWMTHGESRSSMTKPFALKIARLACRIRKDLILLIEQPSFSCLLGHLRCQCWLSLQKSGKCSLEHIIRFYYLELYRYY